MIVKIIVNLFFHDLRITEVFNEYVFTIVMRL